MVDFVKDVFNKNQVDPMTFAANPLMGMQMAGGDVKDFLFGSDASQNISQHGTFTPEQQALFNHLSGQVQAGPNITAMDSARIATEGNRKDLMNLMSQPTAFREAQLGQAIDPNAFNIQAPDQVQANLDRVDLGGLPAGRTDEALNALANQLNPQGRDTSAYFNQTVQQPMLEQFQEEIMPAISRQFSGGGANNFFGSERQRADQNAQENLLQALAREKARVEFEERARLDNQQLGAAQAFGQLSESQAGRGQSGILEGTRINQQAGLADLDAAKTNQRTSLETSLANQRVQSDLAKQRAEQEARFALANQQAYNQANMMDARQRQALAGALNQNNAQLAGIQGQIFGGQFQNMNAGANLLGPRQMENIAFNDPGQAGAAQGFIQGLGQGLGNAIIPK